MWKMIIKFDNGVSVDITNYTPAQVEELIKQNGERYCYLHLKG